MATPINTIYSWFETGDFPTQEQFHASWSSFWHKDETIPMTTINGLSDQFGKYVLVSTFNSHLNDENAHSTYLAKRDASNLTPTNVNDWKAKLGVGDLPENIATYDYDIHNQVMMKDGTTKEATDLGKNIANSSLTSVAGAGLTLGSSWTLNTNGQLYSVTNLPDKSADTSFNKMLIQNSTGQVAWGNGRTLIKNMPALLSDAEKTNWKTEMNGGWTTNTMSVAVIMPPIVDKQDKNYWITLRGTGLNFNPTNFSIDIMNEAGTTVIDNIPNSQVQLYTDGLVLVFYYNFKNFPLGNYRIRLRNGVVEYITGTTGIISVVNSITSTILTGNWESKFYNDVAYTGTYGSGNSANYQSSEVIKSGYAPYATDNSIVQALLSPQFVGANQDFYLEFNTQWNNVHPYPHFAGVWVGISLASSVIQLSNQNIAYIYGYGTDIRYLLNDTSGVNVAGQVLKEISVKTIMVRRGNQLTILTIRDNSVSTVMTKTISTEALKIGITGKNFQKGKEESVNFIISQLFLF